jgi:hypothetical protein
MFIVHMLDKRFIAPAFFKSFSRELEPQKFSKKFRVHLIAILSAIVKRIPEETAALF